MLDITKPEDAEKIVRLIASEASRHREATHERRSSLNALIQSVETLLRHDPTIQGMRFKRPRFVFWRKIGPVFISTRWACREFHESEGKHYEIAVAYADYRILRVVFDVFSPLCSGELTSSARYLFRDENDLGTIMAAIVSELSEHAV